MAKYLVIVESPAKVKTIKKFLGKNYEVMASNGHVRDLPKSQLGFSPENDFEPKYITIRGKGEILAKLRKEVKKADKIYLATDPDREGEAISWHLTKALKLDDKDVSRISFNEITKTAVKACLRRGDQHPAGEGCSRKGKQFFPFHEQIPFRASSNKSGGTFNIPDTRIHHGRILFQFFSIYNLYFVTNNRSRCRKPSF